MESWYTALRHIHMTTIALSGIFFLVRAIAVNLAGAGWPRLRPVRMSSYAIDTVLLASAIALTVVTGQYPFADAWLTVKVVLLVVYIALGVIDAVYCFWELDRDAIGRSTGQFLDAYVLNRS